MTGKIGRDRPGEQPDWVTMDQFTTELVDAAIDWAATGEDTARVAAAQGLEGTDYATSMSRRRGAKLSFI